MLKRYLLLAALMPVCALASYSYRRPITVDHTRVPNTDQTNFPVLVTGTLTYLKTTGNGGLVRSSSGYDIIITSDTGCTTLLPFERVVWGAGTGTVGLWMKASTVSAATDTVIGYLCYGDATVTSDQSNPTAVWDSNYILVSHFPNGTTLSVADSTGLNSATNNGATATSGVIGTGAAAFNGSSQFIDYGNTASNFIGDITMQAWINVPSTSTVVILGNQDQSANRGYQLYLAVGGPFNVFTIFASFFDGSGSLSAMVSATTLNTNTWYHVAATITSGVMRMYINSSASPLQFDNGAGIIGHSSEAFRIGKNSGGFFYGGMIDEARVSKIARSGDWLAAAYNNESSPGTFYTLGAQVNNLSVTKTYVNIQ